MKQRAFTLIELLIVVAIIAILAAIAVPNFLEAQVRSKISRIKSDMRTLAAAIEAYIVDNNEPPPGQDDYQFEITPGASYDVANQLAQNRLTTPIAYITSLPFDAFYEKIKDTGGRRIYTYMAFDSNDTGDYLAAYRLGYVWGLQSKGPSLGQPFGAYGMHSILSRRDGFHAIYDPTNGSVSSGVIIRTNKGILDGSSSPYR